MTVVTIGIDVGTQGVRAVAVTHDGDVLAEGRHSWPLSRDGGPRHEQDPATWWAGTLAVLGRLASAMPQPPVGTVTALAVTSTSGTLVLTDADGGPLAPAIMWDDTRAVTQAEAMAAELAGFTARTGLRMRPSFPLAKLRWLAEQEPTLLSRVVHVLHQSDWLLWRLGAGRAVTDPTNALKTGYDPTLGGWDPLLAREGWEGLLPEIVPAGTVVGTLGADVACRSGLPAGASLVTAMTDANTATLAAGLTEPGQWSSTLGTGLSVKGLSATMLRDSTGAVYSHLHPAGGWLVSGTSHCGAAAVAGEFGSNPAVLDDLEVGAERCEPGELLVYPLAGRGDFFPFWAAHAQRFEVGASASPAGRFRATLEGVAVVERMAFDRMSALGAAPPAEITVLGGATRSMLWTRIRASMQRRSLRTVQRPDTAVGAAITASAAAGGGFPAAVQRTVRYGPVVEPDPALADRYDELAARYRDELAARGYLNGDPDERGVA